MKQFIQIAKTSEDGRNFFCLKCLKQETSKCSYEIDALIHCTVKHSNLLNYTHEVVTL